MKTRTWMNRFLLMLGLGAVVTPVWPQATLGGDWRADLRTYAQRMTDGGLVPGLGVAVVVGDRVVFSEGFGLADRSNGVPVDEGTRFYIASTSKALTATAVVALAEQGRIDLNAPVTDYLPNLQFGEGADADSVTIHDLLTMTEGLDDAPSVIFRTAYSGEFTPEELIELLADYPASESGRDFDYSNLPYNILGLVLDAVGDGQLQSGGWKPVVRQTVLDPLGMAETTAMVSSVEANRIAMPHVLTSSGDFERVRLAKGDANMQAGGGHLASARSLARFLAVHVGGGSLEGRRVFSPSMIERTHREHAQQDREAGDFHRDGWGYGWDRARWREERILQRFGGFVGYYSHLSFMPEHGVGVVVLSNGVSGLPAADLVAFYAYDRLLGREGLEADYDGRFAEISAIQQDRAQAFAQAEADRAERLQPLPHALSAYAGTYYNEAIGTMRWQLVAGGLEVSMGAAHSRAEVFSASENQLRVTLTGGGTVVGFEFPEGEEQARSVRWGGEVFTRQP